MAHPMKGLLLIACGLVFIFPAIFNFLFRFIAIFIGVYLILLGILAIVQRDWE